MKSSIPPQGEWKGEKWPIPAHKGFVLNYNDTTCISI